MRLHGVPGQEQLGRDVGVGQALRDEVSDPHLGWRERGPPGVRTIPVGARDLPHAVGPQPRAGAADMPLRP